jgi:transducin (beta)-like 1
MTMNDPIVSLAFTPDGAFIAGATHERILIWKVGDHSIPRASWSRMPHPGWHSPRMSNDTEEEDEHCLCWDSTGHKLAYGVNSRVRVKSLLVTSKLQLY